MTIEIEAGASRIEYSTKRSALAVTIHQHSANVQPESNQPASSSKKEATEVEHYGPAEEA